ncbi:LysR family transcriptional regulator [uncultured Shimia sp.]|uniref:LysR family transcriptional regulator n=1 Tax=uncultured Shimia sp. TaxID=573152 RepID=UPI00260AFD1F|nr:LysR family transcriptional regulator [uncultured Shimia sp.]
MDWATLPSLAALRAFEAAARHQNLSAAARELNVTHAAIAQHVRSLEAELSTPLLFRSGRGVALTEEGRHLAQHLSDGFEVISEGVSALQRSKEDRPLSVSVTPSFAANWLMPRIGGFWQKHPEISLSINPSVSLIDLRRDGFDMAIRFGNGQWPGVSSELLTSGEFWVVASPKLLKTNSEISLTDAGTYPWLMDLHMLEWRQVVEDAGLDLNTVEMTSLETNELVLSATVAGLGVSVHPRSLVEREVAFGTLVQITSLPRTDLGYHLVTLPRPLNAKERAFRKWLMAEAKT